MISFRRQKGTPILRLHESFALADSGLTRDLSAFLYKNTRRVPESVKKFVNKFPERKRRKLNTNSLAHQGKYCDLKKIYRKINKACFNNQLKGVAVWGRKIFSENKRTIIFGSYYPSERIIRIHPVLDTELAPMFYLEAVMHHEMVHEFLDKVENYGEEGALSHSSRFRELESKFKYHALANAWEKRHFEKLMSYRPKTQIRYT
ncbi:MAG: hypothetical protein ACE5EN_02055 [Nitrospinota bacterium]